MQRSFCVLLPVFNVQSTLAAMVQEILEVVSELTDRFELVIIDDGSADATSEVAHELTQRYPQVRAVYHTECLGREVAIRTGLEHSTGEIILLRDETFGLTLDATAALWRTANEQGLVLDGLDTTASHKWSRLNARHGAPRAGYQMIDRQTMGKMHSLSQPIRPNYLDRLKKLALGE